MLQFIPINPGLCLSVQGSSTNPAVFTQTLASLSMNAANIMCSAARVLT